MPLKYSDEFHVGQNVSLLRAAERRIKHQDFLKAILLILGY